MLHPRYCWAVVKGWRLLRAQHRGPWAAGDSNAQDLLFKGRSGRQSGPGFGSLWKEREIGCWVVLQVLSNNGVTNCEPFRE